MRPALAALGLALAVHLATATPSAAQSNPGPQWQALVAEAETTADAIAAGKTGPAVLDPLDKAQRQLPPEATRPIDCWKMMVEAVSARSRNPDFAIKRARDAANCYREKSSATAGGRVPQGQVGGSDIGASTGARSRPPGGTTVSAAKIPVWVPIYPGATIEDVRTQETPNEIHTWFNGRTMDDYIRVRDYYGEKLKLAGYHVFPSTSENLTLASLQGKGPGETRKVYMSASGGPTGTTINVHAIQLVEARGSLPAAKMPQWVPIYPGSAPANLVAHESHGEYRLSFSFTTDDKVKNVLDWYAERLKTEGFRVDTDQIDDSRGVLWSNTRDNSRALKLETSAAGSKIVVLIDVRQNDSSSVK